MWTWLQSNSSQLQALAAVFQVIGLIVVIITLAFTVRQLTLTAKQVKFAAGQTQGATIQELAKEGRELFMKVLDDPNLRHIVDSSAPDVDPAKADIFMGILIQHYAIAFRQWKLGNIPQAYWEEVEKDARGFFRNPQVKKRWQHVKHYYKEDFIEFVEKS